MDDHDAFNVCHCYRACVHYVQYNHNDVDRDDDDDDDVDDSDLQDNHDDDHDHAIFSLSDECKCCVSGVTL